MRQPEPDPVPFRVDVINGWFLQLFTLLGRNQPEVANNFKMLIYK